MFSRLKCLHFFRSTLCNLRNFNEKDIQNIRADKRLDRSKISNYVSLFRFIKIENQKLVAFSNNLLSPSESLFGQLHLGPLALLDSSSSSTVTRYNTEISTLRSQNKIYIILRERKFLCCRNEIKWRRGPRWPFTGFYYRR